MYSIFFLIKGKSCNAFLLEFYSFIDKIEIKDTESINYLLNKYKKAKIYIFFTPNNETRYVDIPDVKDKYDMSLKIVQDDSFKKFDLVNLCFKNELSIFGIELDDFSKKTMSFIRDNCKRSIFIYEYYGSFVKSFLFTLNDQSFENINAFFLIIKDLNSFGAVSLSSTKITSVKYFECYSDAEFYDKIGSAIKINTLKNKNLKICIFAEKKILNKIKGYEFSMPVENFVLQDICSRVCSFSDHMLKKTLFADAEETTAFNCSIINSNEYFFVDKDRIDSFFNRNIKNFFSKAFLVLTILLFLSAGFFTSQLILLSTKENNLLIEQAIKREQVSLANEDIKTINQRIDKFQKMKEKFDELSKDFYCNPIDIALALRNNLHNKNLSIDSFNWEKIDCVNDRVNARLRIIREKDPVKIHLFFEKFKRRFYKNEGKSIELLSVTADENDDFLLEIAF